MHASSRFRGLGRFWRVGVAGLVVAALVIGALMAVGQRRVSNGSDAIAASSRPAGSGAASTAAAPAIAAVPAATSAPRPAVNAAAPTSAVSSGSVNRAASGSTSSDATVLNAPLPPSPSDQKIIRTATIQLTAKDVVATQNAVWNLASELGGNVLTSNTSGTDDNIRAEISFRVPTDRYKEAIDRLHGYAVQVQREQSSAQDVTEEYVDLQARQRNLEATVLQFQALLTKATTVDETLKVQAQLNNAQSDLERIKGRLNYYDQRAAYSTISATILPVPPPAKPTPVTPVATWSFGRSVQEAWNRSVNGLQAVADALITVIIGGWWIELPLLGAVLYLVRRERRRPPVSAVPVPAAGDAGEPIA